MYKLPVSSQAGTELRNLCTVQRALPQSRDRQEAGEGGGVAPHYSYSALHYSQHRLANYSNLYLFPPVIATQEEY